MNYEVKITDSALSDIEGIYRYIRDTLQAPGTAASLYDRIADAVLSLEDLPLRFGIPQFEPCISLNLRRMSVGNYSVFYLVRENTVIVTDVLYSASELAAHLTRRHEE